MGEFDSEMGAAFDWKRGNLAVMRGNEFPHDRQADAGAFGGALIGMAALEEGFEDAFGFFRPNAGAVVDTVDEHFFVLRG